MYYSCLMNQRIIGFDLARAYAIFGMFIVNFRFCFGSFEESSPLISFQNIFVGNSTSIFIILAGMGLSFMSGQTSNDLEKATLKSKILKRSWFFFAIGLLLYSWWPGDILHFYGGYMHIGALVLFIPKRYYIWMALSALIIFHLLLFVIPIETGWDFSTSEYLDFWTVKGFLRNTLYNGWNSIFPWIAYFSLGMYLGKLNWNEKSTIKKVFITGVVIFVLFELIRAFAGSYITDPDILQYIQSEYFPPYLPFMAITCGFALMVISMCMFIHQKFVGSKILTALATTGKMTLTHYVSHITVGMIVFSWLTGSKYNGYWDNQQPVEAYKIQIFIIAYFAFSVCFSLLWSKKFKQGPLESVMRKISG